MKKKALFLFLISIFLLPLAAVDYDLSHFDKGVASALEGKGEHNVEVVECTERFDVNEKRVILTLTFRLDGKEMVTVAEGKNAEEAERNLEKAAFQTVKYTPYPDPEETFLLDYDFKSSFSSKAGEDVKAGSLYLLKGADGKNYGLMRANGKGAGDTVEFEALWAKNIRPGLRLDSTGAGLLSFSPGLSSVSPLSVSAILSYSPSSFLYPVSPVLSLEAVTGNENALLLGLGGRYYLPLSAVFDKESSLIRSSGVELIASLTGGFSASSKVLLGSRAEVYCLLFLSHNAYMGIGFSYGAELDCNGFILSSTRKALRVKGGVRL